MFSFIQKLFDTADFPPRWQCGDWSAGLGWTHILADIAIFGAYTAIPCVLAYFVLRRRDVPFSPIFWLFAAFIFSCGFGHLVEATLFWQPWYRFSGLIKVVTALVSVGTVLALIPIVPKALALPGLATINQQLKLEIVQRQSTEGQLRHHADVLKRSNDELERFTRTIVGREERVIELKHEVNGLLRQLGKEPRYLVESTEKASPNQTAN